MSVPTNKSIKPAYETGLESVAVGSNFGAVPVTYGGEPSVYVTGVALPTPNDDVDVLAHAIFCCKQAREQALRYGAHPVD